MAYLFPILPDSPLSRNLGSHGEFHGVSSNNIHNIKGPLLSFIIYVGNSNCRCVGDSKITKTAVDLQSGKKDKFICSHDTLSRKKITSGGSKTIKRKF